jgi:hypothetical protein
MSETLSPPTAPAWDPSTPSKVFRSELNTPVLVTSIDAEARFEAAQSAYTRLR